jgi:histidine triad (HIT) family protein
MNYDKNNVFAKILRGELPCRKVYEDNHVLAFEDIAPAAPVHVLVVSKSEYVSFNDFAAKAPAQEVQAFFSAVQKIAAQLKLESNGYRVVSNIGPDASQSVHHFHMHILGGRSLGGLLP